MSWLLMDEIMRKAVGYDNFLINKEYSTITDHVARVTHKWFYHLKEAKASNIDKQIERQGEDTRPQPKTHEVQAFDCRCVGVL